MPWTEIVHSESCNRSKHNKYPKNRKKSVYHSMKSFMKIISLILKQDVDAGFHTPVSRLAGAK